MITSIKLWNVTTWNKHGMIIVVYEWGIVHDTTCYSLGVKWRMLLWRRNLLRRRTVIVERLLKSCIYSMETKASSGRDGSSVSGRCGVDIGWTCWLQGIKLGRVLSLLLEHWEVGSVSSTLKGSNDRFLNRELLNRVRRISCQSEMSHLGWITSFWIWKTWSIMLLSAKLIRAFDHNRSAEFKCVLVRSFNVNEKTRPATVIDAGFVMRSWLSLLVAATRIIMMNTCFTCRRLLPVSDALLRCWLWLITNWQALWLLFLIWEALIISLFQLSI